MSVVGTIVANVVANIDKFESGMKKAASIHQSTIKQISSGQMLAGYNNADDWWKGITSAQRASNSQYQSELAAALEATQGQISSKVKLIGGEIGKQLSTSTAQKLKDSASSISSAFSVVSKRAAGVAGVVFGAASTYDWLKRNQSMAAASTYAANYAIGIEQAAQATEKLAAASVKLTGLQGKLNPFFNEGIPESVLNKLRAGKPVLADSVFGNQAAINAAQRQRDANDPNRMTDILERDLESAKRIAQEKIAALGSAQEYAFFKTTGQLAPRDANGNIASMEVLKANLVQTGFFEGLWNGNDRRPQIEAENKFNEAMKEHAEKINALLEPQKKLNEQFGEMQVAAANAAEAQGDFLKKQVQGFFGGNDIFGKVNQFTAGIVPRIGDPLRAAAEGALMNGILNNRTLHGLNPAVALKAELARIEIERSSGRITGDTATLLTGQARNSFASSLGSGFNQTRLFGAMEQGSAAAVSAINEAQNRRKSPEEMTLNEQLEEAKRQTKLLEKIGERTVIEAKAAGFN